MASSLQLGASQTQTQTQTLSPQLRQGLKMLAMSLPELRAELFRELSENPVIEDIESTLERTTLSDKEAELKSRDRVESSDYLDDSYSAADGFASGLAGDTEALERREKFFARQTREESLEEHLINQLASSDVDEADRPLAEMLIGDLDDNGYFAGSLPDIMMVSGESEAKVREVLSKISQLDPAGCGATTPQECLLAQLDKLDGSPYQQEVRELIERHWQDMAEGNLSAIEHDLGISHERYADALRALRSLEPRPGRAYGRAGRAVAYVNPEVHAVRGADGRWIARVDDRSLPEIRISPRYEAMLRDPAASPETKAYVRERLAAAHALAEAVEHRQDTVSRIAQALFDAQPGFFTDGLKGLRPLTMQEIAEKVGVHHATVSRTVNDKYASTPKGTVELRRFFVQGVATADGEAVAKDRVAERIRAVVDGEDKSHPLSDEKIARILADEKFVVARRTVAKYRKALGIPGTSERRA